ncbi:MAG TPA: glycosyltransferase [Longimicrobiales bacterium]
MPRDARVSVIIPCRDAEAFLAEAIESVLAQRGVEVEPIVVDDGSRDRSWQIAQSYGALIVVVRQEARGACHARNHGARRATGRYLMFLDADDVLAEDALAAQVDALGGRTDRIAACAWSWLRRAGGRWRVVPGLPIEPPGGDPIAAWLDGWYIPPCALVWPREAFRRTGGWDETILADQDGDLMLRALIGGVGLAAAPGGHAYYRDHGTARLSVSKNVAPEALRSRRRVIERAADALRAAGRAAQYRPSIGRAFHRLAKMAYDADREFALDCERQAERLAGRRAITGPAAHRLLCRLVGLDRERRIARAIRRTGVLRLGRRIRLSLRPAHGRARTGGRAPTP